MSRVKICGLRREADIAIVNRYRPDYIGFVFAPGRRQVSEATARMLRSLLQPGIQAVGVFVNQDTAWIESLLDGGIIDVPQLHGDEDEAVVRRLQRRGPVIRAVRVGNQPPKPDTVADYPLFDAWVPDQRGGSGKAFRWDLIQEVKRPYFLAGGLHSGNVGEAVERLHPYCVDVSSGVETDGYKDENKVAELIRTVREVRS